VEQKDSNLDVAALHTGRAVIIGLIYVLSSFVGVFFGLNGSNTAVIWPQSGIALALVLLIGYPALPGIFLGSIAIALLTGVSIPFAGTHALGNTLAAWFAAHFIGQQKNFTNRLDNYQSVLSLLFFGMLIAPFISSAINVIGLYSLELAPVERLPAIWGERWMRSALGTLIFTPIILVWFGSAFPRLTSRHLIEGGAVMAAIVVLGLTVFLGDLPYEVVYPISFLVIPLIIWGSIRNNIHISSVVNFVAGLFFLWGVARSQGALFNGNSPSYTTYICVIATMLVTSMVISASMEKLSATQKSLSFLSTHDSLTGLFNRLFFETEFKRLEKSRQFPISVIMADIDELKYVNDTFGHRSGDQLLINVAKLFSDIFRQEDIVSRYGGDEFVILLPNTDSAVAKKVVKRIQSQINDYNKKHADLPIKISMGVSTANQGEDLQGHLKNADKLMYEEKMKRRRKSKEKS